MSLGVDDYLRWSPADLSVAASWLAESSKDMEMSAKAFRRAADNGTANQCGSFIDARRTEAADIADRIDRLAKVMQEASDRIKTAERDLVSAVGNLRGADLEMRDSGFERAAGDVVTDTRITYADASERHDREKEADYHAQRIRGFLNDVKSADEMANRDLHEVVDRDVRDRTAKGNGDPFAGDFSAATIVGSVTTAAAALAEGHWEEAARAAGRGLAMVRGLGPAAGGLGFLGAVAARPEDEPLLEAIAAEGVGTIAGAAGLPLGVFLGGAAAGPPGAVVGGGVGLAGGAAVSSKVASEVREAFDRAN